MDLVPMLIHKKVSLRKIYEILSRVLIDIDK